MGGARVSVMPYPYMDFRPAGYEDNPETRYPLLLYLHGAGERGTDFKGVLRHGPHKFLSGHPEFQFITIGPQCAPGDYWEADDVLAVLDDVQSRFRIDPKRVYLTGLSMGGFGTFETAIRAPHRFAALAPICGGGDPRQAHLIRKIPTWVFHGAKDDIVPIRYSEIMVEALRAIGGDVRFTVYPEARHDSWTETYNNPELYTWLLEHQRAQGD